MPSNANATIQKQTKHGPLLPYREGWEVWFVGESTGRPRRPIDHVLICVNSAPTPSLPVLVPVPCG
jgi:hypothetical protein